MKEKEDSKISKFFEFAGQNSLSYYLYLSMFNLIFMPFQVNFLWAGIITVFALIVMTVCFQYLLKYKNGVGTFNWFIYIFSFNQLIYNKARSKSTAPTPTEMPSLESNIENNHKN